MIALFAASCTSYQPALELWPSSDASSTTLASTGSAGRSGSAGGSAGSGSTGTSGTGTATGSGAAASGGSIASGSDEGGIDAGSMDAFATPDSGGSAGDGGSVTTSGCNLSVTMTTVSPNGGFSPRNIGAIWVAQGSGTFVKTLSLWAQTRVSHLTLWSSATTAAGLRRNTVDAVTSATLPSHQTHKVSWNCTDTARAVVPDGSYRLYFEMTDDNVTGPSLFVPFTKSGVAATVSPPDAMNFKGVKLVFSP